MRALLPALAAVVLAGCASSPPPRVLNDGELAPPPFYRNWSKFLSAVQRPDAKQVREIYLNDAALAGTPGAGFPEGSIFVMENYAAQANPDGSLKKGPDGKLVKGELLRVFVMGKGAGWGEKVPADLRNGNWVYTSLLADAKTRGPEDLNTCRACHAPLGPKKDFVHRFDEFFATKR